jgi:hypothetical protein
MFLGYLPSFELMHQGRWHRLWTGVSKVVFVNKGYIKVRKTVASHFFIRRQSEPSAYEQDDETCLFIIERIANE